MHFIKMLILFTGILLVGFAVIAFAGNSEKTVNVAAVLHTITERFSSK